MRKPIAPINPSQKRSIQMRLGGVPEELLEPLRERALAGEGSDGAVQELLVAVGVFLPAHVTIVLQIAFVKILADVIVVLNVIGS
jgi:hypothetical protein